jgi:hypothetical protein
MAREMLGACEVFDRGPMGCANSSNRQSESPPSLSWFCRIGTAGGDEIGAPTHLEARSDGRPTHWAIKIRNQRGHEGVHESFMNPPSRWFVVLILWGRTYAAQDEPNRFAAS